MTKDKFLAAYEQSILQTYGWAKNDNTRGKFMKSVQETLAGAATWDHSGPVAVDAWHAIGGRGRPTLKALRALPEA